MIKFAILLLLAGCTMIPIENSGTHAQIHVTVMPATQTSLMSATDGQWSDRAQRAGQDAESQAGDVSATQTATAVPTVSIPLTTMSPGEAASGLDTLLNVPGATQEVEGVLEQQDLGEGKTSKPKKDGGNQ